MAVNIPSFTLNNGVKMPALGYGTWLGLTAENEFDYSGWDKMVDTLSYCINAGYRHIDTAHLYRIEPAIGEIVKKKIADGVVTREDLFITSKVWQHFHREADLEVSVRGSLRRLDLDYLDQVLVHWPMAISQDGVDEMIDYLETWRGFESMLRKGLVRSIGVSNFSVKQLRRLLRNCSVKPVVNQVELNLTFGQKEMVDFCAAHDIRVVAWAPLGCLAASRAPPSAPERRRASPSGPEPGADHPSLVAVASRHGKTVVQVALRYLYQRGIVTIPKTVTPSRALENAAIFDFELSTSECDAIALFDVNYRSNRPTFWQEYTNYPFERYDVPATEIPAALLRWRNGKNSDID